MATTTRPDVLPGVKDRTQEVMDSVVLTAIPQRFQLLCRTFLPDLLRKYDEMPEDDIVGTLQAIEYHVRYALYGEHRPALEAEHEAYQDCAE